MKARKLTTKFVESFPAPEAGRDSYPDIYLRRLVLRVRSTGAKTWAVVKRVQGTERQRLMAVLVRTPLLPVKSYLPSSKNYLLT